MSDEILARLDQLLDGQYRLAAEVAALHQVLETSFQCREEVEPRRLSRTDEAALRVALGRRAGWVRNRTND